jgi:hypothetical protein
MILYSNIILAIRIIAKVYFFDFIRTNLESSGIAIDGDSHGLVDLDIAAFIFQQGKTDRNGGLIGSGVLFRECNGNAVVDNLSPVFDFGFGHGVYLTFKKAGQTEEGLSRWEF